MHPRFAKRYFSASIPLSYTEYLLSLLSIPTHSFDRPVTQLKTVGFHEEEKGFDIPKTLGPRLRTLSNLMREISSKNARSVEAYHSLGDNVYNGPDSSILKDPNTEHQITDAMGTPLGSLAKIFSADLPPELWIMVFKNLSQNDHWSCLRVSRKVCGSSLHQSHDHANKFVRNCSGTRSPAMIHSGESSSSSVTSSSRASP